MTNHFDENMKIIDTDSLEKTEQDLANKFISYNDTVLEIGGRYGTVSTIINKKLKIKKNQVVIEPDPTVLQALEINKKNHGCEFQIETGVVSNKKQSLVQDGYGTRLLDNVDTANEGDVKSMTYRELKNKYNLKFNTLVVDCEGCFLNVLESIGDDITEIEKIILEKDQAHLCDYNKIEDILKKNNFTKIIDAFHSVYIRNNVSNLTNNVSNNTSNFKPSFYKSIGIAFIGFMVFLIILSILRKR